MKEARKRVDNLIAQARELGIHNFEDMTALDLQRAVHHARNRPDQITQTPVPTPRTRPVPAPRPPPDQTTRTPPVPKPRTQRPLLIPHLPLPIQTPAPVPPQAPIPPPRPDRPRTAAQIFLQQINLPILKPKPPTKTSNVASLKQLAGRVAEPVKKQLNKFPDWILSYVPEPVKRKVNERVENLKSKVNEIIERIRKDKFKPREHEAVLKGNMKTFRIDGQKGVDDHTFVNNIKDNLKDLINSQKKPIKIKCILTSKFRKTNPATGQVKYIYSQFHSRVHEVYDDTDVTELVNIMRERILENVATFQNKGSGWIFDEVVSFDILIDHFETVAVSSYMKPRRETAVRKAVLNPDNKEDNECFKWAITIAEYPSKKNPQKVNKRVKEDQRISIGKE